MFCLNCNMEITLATVLSPGAPALEAAKRARERDPGDLLAASVELGARRLLGEKDLAALGHEVSTLEDRATDTAGVLTRRAASRLLLRGRETQVSAQGVTARATTEPRFFRGDRSTWMTVPSRPIRTLVGISATP